MSINLFESKQELRAMHAEIEGIEARASSENRELTKSERDIINAKAGRILVLQRAIAARENDPNSLRNVIAGNPALLLDAGRPDDSHADGAIGPDPRTRSAAYATAFHKWVSSKGTITSEILHAGADGTGGFLLPGSERLARASYNNPGMSAALDEATPGSGGYAVPSITIPLIVPLGMPDLGIFQESTVIPTAYDQKWPIQASFGQAASKAESGSTTNAFQEIDPTIGQFTLSAYMVGGLRVLSWELIQDVPEFQSFATDDLIRSQLIYEGNWYVSGTGTGQAQGLLGNVGTGVGSPYNLAGTSADAQTLLDAVFDVVGQLKAVYQPNAVWTMNRATAVAIRRAEMQSNIFVRALTTDPNGTMRLLGYRIAFDSNLPNLPNATTAGVTPILFGSFKDGYLIGVRGGAGINVKVLDQPLAINGQTALLAYRRVDGRVRRSEAIQQIEFSHS